MRVLGVRILCAKGGVLYELVNVQSTPNGNSLINGDNLEVRISGLEVRTGELGKGHENRSQEIEFL